MSDVFWDDKNIEILKKCYAEGLSSSQIAAKIPYATRNAVIGKIYRLGLMRDDKPKQPPKPRRAGAGAGTLARLKSFVANTDPGFVEVPANVTGIPISEREGAMCCWPLDGGTCCGAATVGFRKPYCAEHTDRARRA
jgi:hypothetical protein